MIVGAEYWSFWHIVFLIPMCYNLIQGNTCCNETLIRNGSSILTYLKEFRLIPLPNINIINNQNALIVTLAKYM